MPDACLSFAAENIQALTFTSKTPAARKEAATFLLEKMAASANILL